MILNDVIQNKLDAVNKQYIENHFLGQFATMPAASLEYNGKIVQYTGGTTADYTHGYFYECKTTAYYTVNTTGNEVPAVCYATSNPLATINAVELYSDKSCTVSTGWHSMSNGMVIENGEGIFASDSVTSAINAIWVKISTEIDPSEMVDGITTMSTL